MGLNELDEFEEPVYLKNQSGVLVWSNSAYRNFFAGDRQSPIGQHGKAFLDPTIFNIALLTDQLILNGSEQLECEHVGVGGDGSRYVLVTHKTSLRYLRKPGYAILGVTRPIRRLGEDEHPGFEQVQSASIFRALEPRDQELCRLIAMGHSSAEIGQALGMTPRNVDLRRAKCFELLGVEKAVDLARLLTRLQERGYLEIDLSS